MSTRTPEAPEAPEGKTPTVSKVNGHRLQEAIAKSKPGSGLFFFFFFPVAPLLPNSYRV